MDSCSYLLTLLTFLVYVECQPVVYSTTLKQACGDKLVDMMQLVCGERGYNPTFRSQEKVRRIRRGIVEECCRRSCSQDILELYCRPEDPESPTNVQKRKRSDYEKAWLPNENQIININEETLVSTESPNSLGQIYNKEATQRSILKSLDHRIPQSSREEEINSLGVILNTRPVSDPIRHWHSKKTLQRHQVNKVPANNADEDKSTAFQIGVQKPYYTIRKQSRPRSHHSYPH